MLLLFCSAICGLTEKADDAAWGDVSSLPDRQDNTCYSLQPTELQDEATENIEGCEAKLDCGQCAGGKAAGLSAVSAVHIQSSGTPELWCG